MRRSLPALLIAAGAILVGAGLLAQLSGRVAVPAATPPANPTRTAEALNTVAARTATLTPSTAPRLTLTVVLPLPTRTATDATPASPVTPGAGSPTGSVTAFALPTRDPAARARIGVDVVAIYPLAPGVLRRLGVGWYLSWTTEADPPSAEAEFWQLIVLRTRPHYPDDDAIAAVARARPGSAWIIGNEPDVAEQDNLTPEEYAARYHELYGLLKAADPTCRVVIGAVSQPTPLRLAYWDRVLAAYQTEYGERLPVDVWSVHNYMLREERGSWGTGIPPGFADNQGTLYEIDDTGNVTRFQEQIRAVRRWMAERGYRDRPLVVSEFGIPMPEEYGFPPERVQAFLRDTLSFLLTAADPETGYPADGNRLVQRAAWFSLYEPAYPTGNLVDGSGALTPLGNVFADYVAQVAGK